MDFQNYGWSTDEEKQININKYNGQYVMATLRLLRSKATENELLRQIVSTVPGQPHKLVEQELRRILNNGVANGFVIKSGNEYLLPIPQLYSAYQIDSDAKILKKVKEEPEDSESDLESEEECAEESDEQKVERLQSDYLNVIEEMMSLNCILFRNKLLSEILDVVVKQKENEMPKCEEAVDNIFALAKLPDEHADALTKDKLKAFYSAAYELFNAHDVCIDLLRYTVMSLDKALISRECANFSTQKRNAIFKFVHEIEQIEKADCEKFRTVYIFHLLNIVAAALKDKKEYASGLLMYVKDKNGAFSCTLKNFIQKAFVLGQLGCSRPIQVFFKFLSDRTVKAPKRKGKGKGRGGGARKRKC